MNLRLLDEAWRKRRSERRVDVRREGEDRERDREEPFQFLPSALK